MMRQLGALLCGVIVAASISYGEDRPPEEHQVSFQRDVRPILVAHCQGCHQPAKPQGQFVLTDFSGLMQPGESENPAIVPGDPDASYLMQQIEPVDGYAEMPRDAEPLSAAEVETIRRWIAQGAKDDSPSSSGTVYSKDNPPLYTHAPIITSLDYSPDGSLLAVAGFHEVILVDPETQETVARLVGMSERIESVRFSPDGSRIAVSGGSPGRMGEVQVWDAATHELLLSVPVTYDTVYGVSWSPDGEKIAFGCADNSLRAIDSRTGEQVLFQGAHNDWIRDTVFTTDGSHVVSVSRDMTVKLTEVATQRFVDNVTSITPGALRGGVNSIERHPQRDEVVVGGADGVPKVYRVYRETERRIGDDANMIRSLDPMRGRIFSVAVNGDGSRIAAVSSLDGEGQLAIFAYNFSGELTDELKKILGKRVADRSAEEKAQVDAHRNADVKRLALIDVPETSLYAVAFGSRGSLAAAGADGRIRLYDAATGDLRQSFLPVEIGSAADSQSVPALAARRTGAADQAAASPLESLPAETEIGELRVEPERLDLSGSAATSQLLITARTAAGDLVDVTRMATVQNPEGIVTVDPRGLVRPLADGTGSVHIALRDQRYEVPVTVGGLQQPAPVDFIRDVNPVLTRLGCNQGTCHGSANGKNGFKLSLRGYDPLFDVRGFTDDLAGRRINLASPDDSLMLLKTSGAVPHEGGVLMQQDDEHYQTVRRWIADGAKLELSIPRVDSIAVSPINPVIPREGMSQQVRVVARYNDGSTRDVTQLAFVSSSNTEVATVDESGLLTAVRRGEAAVLVRYEGAYAATTMTVMGDRSGFQWEEPQKWNEVDRLVAEKWKRMKILPSGLCTDEEFVRRATLDLTGLPPTAAEVRTFLADKRSDQEKRAALVDGLIGSEAFIDRWTNKWADLLQVNRKFLGVEGSKKLGDWIRTQVAENRPYDEFVRDILTATGSNNDNPPAAYFKILRSPEDLAENTTHLFLGVRFNCNKCHDHPFERWTQDQYYETAAFFAQVERKRDPASGDRTIGGTAVESATPLFERIGDDDTGEVTHQRTGAVAPPQFPYETEFDAPEGATRREKLAAWMTSPDNRYFARSFANRMWGYLMGTGIMEPVDDLRAGNPPTNPQLLDYLTQQFIDSGFDVRHLIRVICTSRTYGLSIETNEWNEDDQLNYSHALPRRLPAEVLYDAVYASLGAQSQIPGVPAGTRATQLPDAGVQLADNFLDNLGRPVRESACECERSSEMQLGSVMAMVSGPSIATAIADPNNALSDLIEEIPDNRKLVDELFLRILARRASRSEIDAALAVLPQIEQDHQRLTRQLEQREAWWKEEKPRREAERLAAIEEMKKKIAAEQQRLAPARKVKEQQRELGIAEAEKALSEYRAKMAEPNRQYFEQRQQEMVEWFPLAARQLEGGKTITLTPQPDRSILASGKSDKGVYQLEFETSLANITGLRLEALADPDLPGGGPGLPENGNFVITELQVRAGTVGEETALKPVTIEAAEADYAQDSFDIKQAFDGNEGDQRGWAVSPATGTTHWAVFTLAEPVGAAGETTRLAITLHQNHNAKQHLLGRFRISVTTASGPLKLGLPDDLASAVATPEKARSGTQTNALATYREKTDPKLAELNAALAEARKPVPEFPEIVALQSSLKFLEEPLPEDAQLVRLRSDHAQSKAQLQQRRLTMVQDLAWALINSPAFLFNR